VFFRVSAEEFQEMESICTKVGARSISEFARVAARRCMDESRMDQVGVLLDKLAVFERAIDELQAKVQRYRGAASEEAADAELGNGRRGDT
jgi:hypothetical protein